MKRRLFLALLLSVLPVAAEPPPLYPFEITLAGQKATVKNNDDLFATVANPVPPDATLSLEEKAPMIIINAFPCDADGTVHMDRPALVIFAQDKKELKLDETLDEQKLVPGTYLMNVVANQKTSRVVFSVTDGKSSLKLPDLSKIVEFLKKK